MNSEQIIEEPSKILFQEDLDKLQESFKLLHNITEQVSIEASNTVIALSDTSYKFMSIIDSIMDIVIVKDCDGKWVTANNAAKQLLNLNNFVYIGKTDQELMELFPYLKEKLELAIINDQKAWNNTNYYRSIENFHIYSQLKIFDIIRTPIYNSDGTKKELIIIGRDITEFKNNENRNRACYKALNSVSDNIAIVDADKVVNFCNDAFVHTFDFLDHTEIEGRVLCILHGSNNDIGVIENLWNIVASNRPWTGILTTNTKLNKKFNCLVSIIPIINETLVPVYYLFTLKTRGVCKKYDTCKGKHTTEYCINSYDGCKFLIETNNEDRT